MSIISQLDLNLTVKTYFFKVTLSLPLINVLKTIFLEISIYYEGICVKFESKNIKTLVFLLSNCMLVLK